jgi:3',5'-cyclic AMP phosphodiesterase CpdA
MRLAFTADLHWGQRAEGDAATQALAAFLRAEPPDVLVLAGDVGTEDHFAGCLALFADLPGRKALVPGNHDVWVRDGDPRGDSLQLYRDYLPRVAEQHGFHYLDSGPLFLPEANLALAGSMNWYDYSWALPALRYFPDAEDRLRTKRFSRGRHNDANYVRWPLDDAGFTREVVTALEGHLDEARRRAGRVIVVTHHPPFRGMSFPRPAWRRLGRTLSLRSRALLGRLCPGVAQQPWVIDSFLWDAFAGNAALEDLLRRHDGAVPFAFCGHTHRANHGRLAGIRGHNIGGDYTYKRLLLLDWPSGTVRARDFHPGVAP